MNPPDLRYSQEHEWVRMESEDTALVGITAYAAEQLGDVVFVDLPDKDAQLTQAGQAGEIESVKAVSDIFSPVSGRVIERNDQVLETPELVNDSPYEGGWLLKVSVSDASEMDKLMTADQYEGFVASLQQ